MEGEVEIMNKKTALITGASDGIGRALAVALAAEGYEITAVARSEDRLKALCNQLGGGSRYLVADLSTETAQDRVAEELTTRHYDVLVNNAGVATSGRLTDVPLAKQVAMVRLNNEAIVKLAYAFLMKAESGDALINTSSTLAFLPMPSLGLYCATKAFVTSFSETLWFEYKDKGIYVMGLCPGPTETNFVVNSGGNEANIPKGMLQTPEQVAKATIKALKAARKPTVISGIKNVRDDVCRKSDAKEDDREDDGCDDEELVW